MPTKFGLNAFHVTLYVHEFFEPILMGNFGCFEGKQKGGQNLQKWRGHAHQTWCTCIPH